MRKRDKMMIVKVIDQLRQNISLLARLGLAALVLLLLWDVLLLDKSHAHIALERLPGFWALFGLAAAVALIVLARLAAGLGLQTDEDYYDK
ncbi:MAG: hypothetical protein U5J62_11540 [Desulfurivibrio sp.]|nr:hypothetical protein [Desulfurivibrio sp.]